MKWRAIETARGVRCRVLEGGGGSPLVFLHGAAGLLRDNPFLDALARRYSVFAPELARLRRVQRRGAARGHARLHPHGWDVVDALDLARPHLVAHSMGGMIAAEMACVAPRDLGKLVLVSPAGLWLDDHPIPDVFSLLPFELVEVLFHDPARGSALLHRRLDLADMNALKAFYLGQRAAPRPWRARSSSRSRTAALSKRLYRLTAPTLVLWGAARRADPARLRRPLEASSSPPPASSCIASAGPHAALGSPGRVRGRGHAVSRLIGAR